MWSTRRVKATPPQLARLVEEAASVSFAEDLLEVDEPLWGGFWRGDVIAPGYRLPAVELALLRATRLDSTWSADTSIADYVADLRRAILYPQSGVWTLAIAQQPGVVFVAQDDSERVTNNSLPVTVVWYCATTRRLHAGYRTEPELLKFEGATEQRQFLFASVGERAAIKPVDWLKQAAAQPVIGPTSSLAARLDAEILKIRRGGPWRLSGQGGRKVQPY